MCSTSVINFKTDKTHVLIVRDVIDHFVLIEKTAKRKNTEDDKTSSLDPRKSESCFDLSFMIHPFHQS